MLVIELSFYPHKAAYVRDDKFNDGSTESPANIFVSGVVKYCGTDPAQSQI